MPVQMIELEEVSMIDLTDDVLESQHTDSFRARVALYTGGTLCDGFSGCQSSKHHYFQIYKVSITKRIEANLIPPSEGFCLRIEQ